MSTIKNAVLVIAVAFITKNILTYLFSESNKKEEIKNHVRVFEADELKKLTNGKDLYLSILGKKCFEISFCLIIFNDYLNDCFNLYVLSIFINNKEMYMTFQKVISFFNNLLQAIKLNFVFKVLNITLPVVHIRFSQV